MRYLLSCMFSLLLSIQAFCQLGIGATHNLYIQNGVTFSIDSLVMIPSASITLGNNALIHDYTPVAGVPTGNSIARVYRWNTSITYAGALGIIYSDAELAGNTEGILQVAYKGTGWTTTATSTVNTTTNFVNNASVSAPVAIVTATNLGVVLPVAYTGFSTLLKDVFVQLDWKTGGTDGLTGFEVQFSADARNWGTAAVIPVDVQKKEYSFRHYDLNFSTRYYRVAMLENSGIRTYTSVAIIRSNEAGASLRIVKIGNGLLLYFNGDIPSSIQVCNTQGQLLRASPVMQQPVTVKGLAPGAYVIHYVLKGRKIARVVYY